MLLAVAVTGNGFPRTRGDRPCGANHLAGYNWVPPHTRG